MDARFFRRRLRWLWKQNGLKFSGGRPGLEIENLIRISRKRSSKQKLQHFDLWRAIYDEYCSWVLSLASVINRAIINEQIDGDAAKKFYAVTCIVLWRIVSDLMAIRTLCNTGFDTSAKPLVRVVIEYIDLIYLLNKKPELTEEFSSAEWNEEANAFWHKYLKSKKVRNHMISEWKAVFHSEVHARGFDEWLYGRHDVLGLATHPSFTGSWFATYVPDVKAQEPWLGYLGEKSDVSANTFSEVSTHIWKLMFLLDTFPFEVNGHPSLSLPYQSDSEFHSHVRDGRRALIGMFVSLSDPEVVNLFYPKADADEFPS
jgi:hypothetical protein